MKMNRVPFLRRHKCRKAALLGRPRILAGSIAAFAASLLSFSSVSKTQAATVIFDSDATGANGITESGGTFTWQPGTTFTFINPLTSLTTEITGATTDVYQFGGNGMTLLSGATVNITTGTAITGLVFGATGGNGYTLTASAASQSLSIGTSGIVVNAGAFATLVGSANLGITLGGAQTWTNASANALTIAGDITNGANLLTLGATGAGAINITGNIVGAGGGGITVNSTGSGITTLSGNNTYTGTTTLTAGILRATTNATALGAITSALTLNGGTLQLASAAATPLTFRTTGLTTVGGSTTIVSDLTAAGAGNTYTFGALSIGAFTLTSNVGAFVNATGGTGLTFGATTVSTTGAVINTNNSFFAAGITNTTTLASLSRTTQALTIGGTGNTVITGGDTGTTGALTKSGPGTLTLGTAGGTATYASSGAITVNGGTVNVTSGTTFTAAPALTFGAANTGGGTFAFNAASAGVNQAFGALSFLGGDGVVQSNYGTSANASVTFTSLAARTSGASGLFVASGGANGTTNKIVLTGVTPGPNGIVIGGGAAGIAGAQAGGVYFFNTVNPATTATPSDYAVYDTGGFVRAINYGTDTTLGRTVLATETTLTASSVNQITTTSGTTGTVTLSAPATVTGIKFSTGTTVLATGANQVTTPSILVAGGGTASITSGSATTGGVTSGTADLVVRTDAPTDQLTINAPIAGVNLTKTGAGTLIVGTGTNTFTGNIYVNGGTYAFTTSYNNINTNTSLGATANNTIFLNGGTLRNNSGTVFNPQATTKVVTTGLAGGTFDLNGQALAWDDGSQLTGTGNLILTNNGAAAIATLGATNGNGTFLGNMIVDPNNTGVITLLIKNAAGAGVAGNTIITVNNKTVLDLQASLTSNIVVGGTGNAGGGAFISSVTGGGTAAATTVTLTADTLINNANGLTFNGVITDAGRNFKLTKTGASFLTLNGANTYSGGTVIATTGGQQLALGNNAALGTGSLTVNAGLTGTNIVASTNVVMTNNVVLNSDTSFGLAGNTNVGSMTFGALDLGGGVRTITVALAGVTTTFTGAVSNGTGLTVAGNGTLALSNTGSFTGPVVVNQGGTLSVGATTLNTAGSLSIGTSVTSGFNLLADGIGAGATLASGTSVTFGGATSSAQLGFQLGTITSSDSLTLTGSSTLTVGAGGAPISITALTGFGAGSYTLITAPSITGFSNFSLNSGTLPTGFTYTFTPSSTTVVLGVAASTGTNYYWTPAVGGGNLSWNGSSGTTFNWSKDDPTGATNANATPGAGQTVNFSATNAGAGAITTTLDQNFSVLGVNFLNSGTGVATVNQGRFGTLTIGTGGITVNTGSPTTPAINAPIVLGGTQTWTVTDGGQTLSIQGGAPANGIVSGPSAVTLAGTGSVTLGGFNTFSGGLTTGTGTLNINNGGSGAGLTTGGLGNLNSALGTGPVNFAAATTTTLDNTSGVAQSVFTTGAQTWGGNLTFLGTYGLHLGSGTVALGGATRTITVSGSPLQIGGIISSAASVGIIKAGPGTLTLGGANTFSTAGSAGLTLNNGKLNINAAAALGVGTFVINNTGTGVTIDNTTGALVTTANVQTWTTGFTYGGSAPLTMATGAIAAGTTQKTITVTGPGLGINNNVLSVTGTITSSGGFIKTGSGSLSLGATNATFTAGGVALQGGTLNFGIINGMGLVANTLTISANTAIDGAVVNTLAYPMAWNGSFAFLGTGSMTMAGGAITAAAGTTTVTAMANTLTLAGAIQNTNTPSITKNGAGQITLTGISLYTGTTTVNAGVLQLNVGLTGVTGKLASTTPLSFSGTGAFIQANIGETSGSSSQSFGATSFNAGDGTVEINHTTAFGALMTLASLNPRATGAVGLLAPGGSSPFTNGTTGSTTSVKMAVTGQTANTIFAPGIFTSVFTGASPGLTTSPYTIGWYDTGGFVRSIVYGTDGGATTATVAGGATLGAVDREMQTTAAITAQTTGQYRSLNLATAAADVTMSDGAQILSLGASAGGTGVLLRNGGFTSVFSATGAISTGGITATGAGNELIIRSDSATDSITLNIPILSSTGAVTKSGVGTLILGGSLGTAVAGSVSNAFTGTLYINLGTLQANSSSATGGNGATGALNSRPIIMNSGILALNFDGDGNASPTSINSGNAVTLNGSAAITVQRLGAGNPISATPVNFITPVNKTVQLGALSFSNAGDTLTVTPVNGYGLEFTGITTLNQNLTTLNVGTVTASNVVPGLTLSGKVTGSNGGGAWTKAGVGTLVLNNGTNDFTGNIILSAGVLAFNNDGAITGTNTPLGNVANTITFTGATAATTLRAYGGTVATPLSISTGRTINLWGATAANNVIEVTANTTLTLNAAFGSNNGPLTKADNGTLVLAADNGMWAGQLVISAGAVRVTNSGALGISTQTAGGAIGGNVNVAGGQVGAALQLAGVNIWDQITLTGIAGVITGINGGGQLEAFSGTNTTNGLILLATAQATIGADSGAILNIRGGINGAQALVFAGAGTINVDTNPLAQGTGGNVPTSITKIGSGTTTISTANPQFVGAITVSAGTLALGGAGGAGSFGGSAVVTTVNPGATLTVDDSFGLPVANRLGGVFRTMTLTGGTFTYNGNAAGPSSESQGALTVLRGGSAISVSPGTGQQASLVFASLTRTSQATVLFSGAGLGSAGGANVGTITLGAIPTFTGAAGLTGTFNKAILPYALAKDTTANTVGFATTDSSGVFNIRPLSSSEQVTFLNAATGANVALASADAAYGALSVNSLNLASSVSVTEAPVQTLTLTSGGILANGTNTINGGILTAGAADLVVHALGNVSIGSTITGSGGLTKAGDNTLTLTSQAYYTGNTNINQGTLKLGVSNAIMPGSPVPINATATSAATLDLNGFTQTTGVFFGENQAAGTGGNVIGTAATSTLVVNQDASSRAFAGVMSGGMSFARSGGNNTVSTFTLSGNNTYTGATLINGNQLSLTDGGRLSGTGTTGSGTPGTATGIEINYAGLLLNDNGTTAIADRVNDAATITMRGGFIVYTGRDNNASSETLGALNLVQGNNRLNNAVGAGSVRSSDLIFGTVTQSNSATLLLEGAGLTGSATALGLIGSTNRIFFANGTALAAANNGIIPWANVNAAELVGYNATYGVGALSTPGFQGYDVTQSVAVNTTLGAGSLSQNMRLTSATASVNYLIPDVAGAGATYSANGIAWATGAATQGLNFTDGTDKLNLTSGALVVSGNFASQIGSGLGNGILTTGGGASSGTTDFYLFKNGGNTLTVNSSIQDSGIGTAKTRLVVTLYNASVVSLVGSNTYSGGTVVNGSHVFSGTLSLGTVGADGSTVYSIPGDLTVNGASVTLVSQGQIKNTGVLTINSAGKDGNTGVSTVTFVGNNTLAGVNFNNLGGGGTSIPTFAIGAGILTLNGNINATSSNVSSTSTISGTGSVELNGVTRTLTVDPILFNGQSVAPDQPSLNFSSIITSTVGSGAGIIKTGNGMLRLDGTNTFTGGVDLQQGGLIIGNNAALGTGGTLTIAAGTTITNQETTGRTVSNPVTVNGDFVFGVRGSILPAQNGAIVPAALTLSGPVNWGAVPRTVTSNSGPTIANTISGPITGGAGSGIIKQGIGMLALTGNNAATLDWTGSQAVKIFGGTLSINADTALGATPGSPVSDNIVLNNGVLTLSAITTLNVNRGISLGSSGGVIDTSTFAVTIPGTVSGAGGLFKNGTGALTLSGANNFTGPIAVNAGTVNFTNATAPTSATGLTVAGGGILNTLNNAGQTFNLGSGAINLGSGAGTATLGLELGGTGAYDHFTTTGAGSTANTVQVNITGIAGFGAGTYNLLTAASGLNSAAYHFAFSGTAAGYALTPSITATNVSLTAAAAANFYWTNLQADGKWNTLANNTLASNWSTDAAGAVDAHNYPGPTSIVNFNASTFTNATATIATTLETPIAIDSLVFNNNVTSTAPATVTAITIAAGAAGTLTIAPATNTNGITLNTGAPATVTISAPIILGAQQTWSVADAATVLSLTGAITGNGFNVTKDGSGILNMQNVGNTYNGSTTIANGVLRAGVASGLDANSAFIVGATGTLRMNGFNAAVGSLSGVAGAIVDNNTATAATLTIGADNSSTNFAGVIQNGSTATMGLTKGGTGTFTLSGANTYTGNTTINSSAGNTSTFNLTGSITGNTTASTFAYGATAGNTIVNLSGNLTAFITTGANIAGAVSVFNQTAGSVTIVPTNGADTQWVANTGGYGYLNITGGTFNTARFDIVGAASATGVVYIGGTGTLNNNTGDFFLFMRTNGTGQMTVGPGGTFTRTSAVSAAFEIVMNGTNSQGTFNVAGGSADLGPARGITFGFATAGAGNLGFVNLAGGTMALGANTAIGSATGTTNEYFNFAGGTLKVNAALSAVIPTSTANHIFTTTLFGAVTNNNNANAAFNTQIGTASNFTGGVTVDTNGFPVSLTNPLLAATGFGVTQADIGDVSVRANNSGYIGAPAVTFSAPAAAGADPASGYAVIDPATGKVTGIVITNPGVYASGETPTITLTGGGGTIAAFTTAALATTNTSGGLTKIGAGTLTLTNTGNTYTGGTTVTAGTLLLGASGVLADTGNVTVNGGTFDTATFAETVATVSLQGGNITGSTGVLTATADYDVRSGSVNFSGAGGLAGSVGMTKTTAGTVTLSNANTFTNAVNVNGGVLSFSAANQLGNASATNTIGFNGGTLRYTGAGAVSLGATRVVTINSGGGTFDVPNINGVLTVNGGFAASTGNLVKTGPGQVIVAGTVNLGTGTVTVSDGTLQAGFGTGGTSAINVSATGTLSMQNLAIEALMLGNTAGALTLAGGSKLGFELNGATNDSIDLNATGTASTAGTVTLNFFNFGAGVVGGTTYNLLTSTSGGLSGATYVVGTAPSGFNYSVSVTDFLVSLSAVTFSPVYWTNSQNTGSWSTLNGAGPFTSNFSTDAPGATNFGALPGINETVIFTASAAANAPGPVITSTLDGNFTIYSLQFIAAPTGVTTVNINQGTSGTLTVEPSTGTGGIDVGANAGNVTIGAPLRASSVKSPTQTWNVDGTGANGSSLTVGGLLTLNAKVLKTGAGALTLSNASNTGAGGFSLLGGTLNANANGALGTGTFTIAAGTTLNNTGGGLATLTGGANVWTGDFTYTGGSQSLDLGTGPVTLGITPQVTVSGNTLAVGGGVDDGLNTFGLTKAGAGTLALNGATNAYNGLTSVTAGTLSFTGAITGGGAISTSGTGALSESATGVISGASTVTQGSSGTSVLAGNNSTLTGGVTITAGQLNINNDNALGSGTFTLSGGAFDSTNGAHTVAANNAQTWTNAATVAFTGTNTLNLGTGAVTLGTDATTGSFTLNNNSALGLTTTSLTVGGNITAIAGGTAGTKTLTIGGAGSTLLSGNLSKGAASNLILTNAATGTLKLPGTSTVQTLNITATGGVVDLTGGSLTLAGGTATNLLASNNATVTLGTITLPAGTAGTATTTQNYADFGATAGTLSVSSVITGPAGAGVDFFPNAGTVVLTGANTFSGPAGIDCKVSVSSIGNVGVAGPLGTGATLGTNPTPINLSNTTNAGTLIYTGAGEVTNRALSLGGTTATSTIDFQGAGTLEFSATGNMVSNGAGAKTLALQSTGTGIGQIDQTIVNATNGGAAIGITKLGTGKWILPATNTYTGTTTVDAGILALTATASQTLGGLTFGSAAANTGTATLDLTGATVIFGGALVDQHNNAAGDTITISAAKTLTVNGSMTVGYAASAGVTTDTKLTIGSGSMVVTGTSVIVGVDGTGTGGSAWFNRAVLDVTGLASFTSTTTNFNVGVGTTVVPVGTVTLSNTANTITATNLNIGASGANNGSGTSTVTLGTGTNVVKSDTIIIGSGKSSQPGILKFASQTLGSAGTFTLTNVAGTGGANITVAVNTVVGTAGSAVGTLDLRGHSVNVTAGTLLVSNFSQASTSGTGTNGTVSFDTGTFNVTTLNLGVYSTAGVALTTGPIATLNVGSAGSTGIFTVSGTTTVSNNTASTASATAQNSTINVASGTLNLATTLLATKNGANTGTTTGTISVTGGAVNVTAGSTFTMASNATAAGTAAGVISITGGSFTSNADIIRGGGAGTTTATITLNGGLLDLVNNKIGTAASTITFNAQAGTLQNLNELNGGGTLAKTTAGTLILTGTNSYTGAVTIAATGIVRVQSNTGLGAISAGTSVTSGANLQLESVTVGAEALTLNGTGTTAQGALSGTGTSSLSGAVTLATNSSIGIAAGADTLTLSGDISGTGAATLTKVGSGTLILSGAGSNYTGLTTVSAGILRVQSANGLGTTAAGTSVTAGANLQFDSAAIGAEALTLNGTGTAAQGALSGTGTSSHSGTVLLATNSSIGVAAGADTLTLSGNISGTGAATLTKVGAGTLILSGAGSNYTGLTTVSAGILRVQNASALGTTAAGTSVTGGANLQLDSVALGAEALTLNGTGTTGQGALSGTGTSSASGTVLLATDSAIGVATLGDTLTLSGIISGTGASTLTKVGAGKVVLSGAGANAYTGQTLVNGGILELNKSAGVNAIAGITGAHAKTLRDVIINSGGTLLLSANEQLANTVSIKVASGGTVTFNATETLFDIKLLSGSTANYNAPVTITDPDWFAGSTSNVAGSTTFGLLNVMGGTNTVFGTTGGPGVLTVGGAGNLNFIQVDAGTDAEGDPIAASPSDINITLNSDNATAGVLKLVGDVTFSNGGAAVFNSSASITSAGAGSNPGQIDLNGATRTFTIANSSAASDMTISAQIIGGAGVGLTKAGLGTMSLTAANTYQGPTTISAGTLQIGAGGATGSLNSASAINIASNATLAFNRNNPLTVANTISSVTTGGSIVQAGFGTTTITGSSNSGFTGTTTVQNGTLAVTGSLSGTTQVNVNDGGTLLLNATGTSNPLNGGAAVTVGGGTSGTLSMQGVSGSTGTLAGALTLSSNSTIDFGTGDSNKLAFDSLFSLGSTNITIAHWTGSQYSVGTGITDLAGPTQDRLVFSNGFGTTYTDGQTFSQITFTDDLGNNLGIGQAISFGGAGGFEIVPVPEPATTALIGAVALCALIGYRERRRFTGIRSRLARK
jgi:autotransporter-associated beta strand protein